MAGDALSAPSGPPAAEARAFRPGISMLMTRTAASAITMILRCAVIRVKEGRLMRQSALVDQISTAQRTIRRKREERKKGDLEDCL